MSAHRIASSPASPARGVLFALASIALASCVPVEDASPAAQAEPYAEGRQCFYPRQVSGFRNAPRSQDGHARIYVDVGPRKTFLFETFGSCPQLRWARGIGFDTVGIGQICNGLDVDLIVPDENLGPQRCPVRMVRMLAAEEEGAR